MVKLKFKEIANKRKATEYEKNIAKEMENYMNKYFNNERNFHANQEMLGMRKVFRVVATNEWFSIPNEIIDYFKHNKVLIEKGLSLCRDCWNQRFFVLHDPDIQKHHLHKDIKAIKNKERSDVIKKFKNHIDAHPMNEEIESIKNMIRYVKSARFLRKRTRKSG